MGYYDCGEYDPCNPKDCECTENDCGCDFFIDSLSCIRHDGNLIECIGAETGSTLESIIKKIDGKLCNLQSGSDGLSAYEIAVQNGFVGTEAEWIDSLNGEDADASCCCDISVSFEYVSQESDFPLQLQSTVAGGVAPYNYQWEYRGNFQLTDDGVYNTANLNIDYTVDTHALAKLTVTDSNGCSKEEYVMMYGKELANLFI